MNPKPEKQPPDCKTCWNYAQCPRAKEGGFCAQWATKPLQQPQHPDAWERGDPWTEERMGPG